MLPFILGVGAGILIDELLSSKKSDKSKKREFYVFVRSQDFGKSTLAFDDYKAAKEIFDKIINKRKVQYRDIVDFDKSEKELYQKWLTEKNIGKSGYPKGLSQFSSVESVSIGTEDEEYESKEF
jgi:hypothetical protein